MRRHSVCAPDYFTACRLLTNTESAAEKTNKHWKRRKESSKTVRWIGMPVAEVEDKWCLSTRRAERAPGTPFSWATCDKTKVASCLALKP